MTLHETLCATCGITFDGTAYDYCPTCARLCIEALVEYKTKQIRLPSFCDFCGGYLADFYPYFGHKADCPVLIARQLVRGGKEE